MKKYTWFMVCLVILSMAFIYGCGSNATSGGGSGDGGGASGTVYYGVNTKGDIGKVTLSGTNFSAEFKMGDVVSLTISGVITTTESGLLSFEVTSTSSAEKIPLHTVMYGLEISNEVLVLAGGPDDGAALIVLPYLSNTAPTAGSYESVVMPWSDWPGAMAFTHGTMEMTIPSTYTYDMLMRHATNAATDWHTVEANYNFTGGKLYKNEDVAQIFVSPKSMFVASNGKGGGNYIDGGLIGTKYDPSFTTQELTSPGRNFRGIAYSVEYPGDTSNITPLKTTILSMGKILLHEMDPSTGNYVGGIQATIEVIGKGSPDQGIIDALCEVQTGYKVPGRLVAYQHTTSPSVLYMISGFTTYEVTGGIGALNIILFEY